MKTIPYAEETEKEFVSLGRKAGILLAKQLADSFEDSAEIYQRKANDRELEVYRTRSRSGLEGLDAVAEIGIYQGKRAAYKEAADYCRKIAAELTKRDE